MIQWLTTCSSHSDLCDAATIISMFLLITLCMRCDLQHDLGEFGFNHIKLKTIAKNSTLTTSSLGFAIGPTSQDWGM